MQDMKGATAEPASPTQRPVAKRRHQRARDISMQAVEFDDYKPSLPCSVAWRNVSHGVHAPKARLECTLTMVKP